MDILKRFVSDESSRYTQDKSEQDTKKRSSDTNPQQLLDEKIKGEQKQNFEILKNKDDLYLEKLAKMPIVPPGTRGKLGSKKMAAVLTAAVGLHAAGLEEVVSEGKYAKVAVEGLKKAAKKTHDAGVVAANFPRAAFEHM